MLDTNQTSTEEYLENTNGDITVLIVKENGNLFLGVLQKTDYSKPENQKHLQPIAMPVGEYLFFG